jgi:hypothetical protein
MPGEIIGHSNKSNAHHRNQLTFFLPLQMKHLTKEINKLGRAIAERVLRSKDEFKFTDDDDFLSSFFVTCKWNDSDVAIKILAKASTDKFCSIPCFQMDEEVVKKIEDFQRVTNRKIIVVLVDTRHGEISYQFYDKLSAGYIDEGVDFPIREPSTKDGPVWWNSCWKMISIGHMSQSERDRLIVLRTKNKADKNQKSIFD